MKNIILEDMKTIKGEPFQVPDPNSEEPKLKDTTDLVELLELLVFNLPRAKLTMKDSIEAGRIYQQFQEGRENGILKLEDEEHKWMREKVNEFGPLMYGINAAILYEALDHFERKHEPKDKKTEDSKGE